MTKKANKKRIIPNEKDYIEISNLPFSQVKLDNNKLYETVAVATDTTDLQVRHTIETLMQLIKHWMQDPHSFGALTIPYLGTYSFNNKASRAVIENFIHRIKDFPEESKQLKEALPLLWKRYKLGQDYAVRKKRPKHSAYMKKKVTKVINKDGVIVRDNEESKEDNNKNSK